VQSHSRSISLWNISPVIWMVSPSPRDSPSCGSSWCMLGFPGFFQDCWIKCGERAGPEGTLCILRSC
jgi:hypothetical protein